MNAPAMTTKMKRTRWRQKMPGSNKMCRIDIENYIHSLTYILEQCNMRRYAVSMLFRINVCMCVCVGSRKDLRAIQPVIHTV